MEEQTGSNGRGDAARGGAVDHDIGGRGAGDGAERRHDQDQQRARAHERLISAQASSCGRRPFLTDTADARPAASPMGTALPVTR